MSWNKGKQLTMKEYQLKKINERVNRILSKPYSQKGFAYHDIIIKILMKSKT